MNHKRQCFNHHRVEIKVAVLFCIEQCTHTRLTQTRVESECLPEMFVRLNNCICNCECLSSAKNLNDDYFSDIVLL